MKKVLLFSKKGESYPSVLEDGNTTNTGLLYENPSTPNFQAYAGTLSSNISNVTLGSFGIIRVLFNGGSSKVIVNDTTPITGNFGTSNMNGFTLARRGSDALNYGNIQVKEVIIRKVADSTEDETAIYNYLADKYSI